LIAGITDKFNVSLLVPYLIKQDVLEGQDYDDSGLGDIYLIGKYKIFDGGKDGFGFVIIPFVGFETGKEEALFGADSMVYGLKFSIDKYLTDNLIWAFNLGYSHQDPVSLGQIEIKNAFLFGISLVYLINEKMAITGEIIGRSDDRFFVENEKYPIEGIISFSRKFNNFQFLIGAGAGINDGYGASSWRAFTGIKSIF